MSLPWETVVAVPARLRAAVLAHLTECAPSVIPCVDCGPIVWFVRSADTDVPPNAEGIWVVVEGFSAPISFECWNIENLRMEIIFMIPDCVGCNSQANAELLLLALLAFASAVQRVNVVELGLPDGHPPLKKTSIIPRRIAGRPAIAATVMLQL